MKKTKGPEFEQALKKLETIVEKLESTDITLEESIKLYEEGLRLSKQCTQTLEDAVLRIEEISADSKIEKGA
ncbi:MAG TPA: exodeoxyribonuclease VII small subunit [Balneolaceae bacterium]|nr:exodeoxyribonuclease VII small subunit [Balneolaceae bacterium]